MILLVSRSMFFATSARFLFPWQVFDFPCSCFWNAGKGAPQATAKLPVQIPFIRNFVNKLKTGARTIVEAIVPLDKEPPSPDELLGKMGRVAKYFPDWKESSVRSVATRT